MSERVSGTVKWFNNAKGFGFISHTEGSDVFVHFRSIRGEGYRTLDEGQAVEFNLISGPKACRLKTLLKSDNSTYKPVSPPAKPGLTTRCSRSKTRRSAEGRRGSVYTRSTLRIALSRGRAHSFSILIFCLSQ